MKQLILNFIQRWKSESPMLFRYITAFGLGLTGMGTALLTLTAIPNFSLPFNLAQYASYLIVGGTCISFTSKLTSTSDK